MSTLQSEAVTNAIVDYVWSARSYPTAAMVNATHCLRDALACGMGALAQGACRYMLGPFGEGHSYMHGVRVPGTDTVLDMLKAAFDMSVTFRWLDFSDTTPVGGHPSDNIGAILAAADHTCQLRQSRGQVPITMGAVLEAIIAAYEIQGCLAEANKLDRAGIGLDQAIYVKAASAVIACHLMGGTAEQGKAALGHVWLDGHPLAAYRHAPNTTERKGWAGGDAASRGVFLAWMAHRGAPGFPQPLSAAKWGFNAIHLHGEALKLSRPLGTFYIENVIFKLAPCQRNGSTAVEAALQLHSWARSRIERIERIEITTHDEAIRRIVQPGRPDNAAARDHCLQYMVAVALLRGQLGPDDYSDEAAADPAIELLRSRTTVLESADYSEAHRDPSRLSCANAIEILTRDGEHSPRVEILYPIGDKRRRAEALPALEAKFRQLTSPIWEAGRQNQILKALGDLQGLRSMPVSDFMGMVSNAVGQ